MSEPHAPSERTAHDHERTTSAQPEHLTYTEAAKRLGITPNAVRMRAARGTLVSVRVNERTLIAWPQPGHRHESHEPHAQVGARERTDRADERLIAQLRDENAYLRQQLDHQALCGCGARYCHCGVLSRGG
jgi:hypothetical protein